jgi:hypothetical protein
MEIFGMTMNGKGHQSTYRFGRVFISTEKVAHIEQYTKIAVVYACRQPFDPGALLANEAVIFHHRLNALAGGVFSHCTAAFTQPREHDIKTFGT